MEKGEKTGQQKNLSEKTIVFTRFLNEMNNGEGRFNFCVQNRTGYVAEKKNCWPMGRGQESGIVQILFSANLTGQMANQLIQVAFELFTFTNKLQNSQVISKKLVLTL